MVQNVSSSSHKIFHIGMASANSPDPCEIISASVVELAVAVCLRLARDEGQKQLDHSRHRNALRYTHTHILEKLAAHDYAKDKQSVHELCCADFPTLFGHQR